MVNQDILHALELLTHKGFVENSSKEFISRNRKIMNTNRIANKSVLIVDETGDIIADFVKSNARSIDYFLENKFSKYYVELKIIFTIYIDYKNFIDFFVKSKDNKKLFNYENYCQISKWLSEPTRLFWDALYESTNYDGMKIRNSDLFEQKFHESYVKEDEYNILQRNFGRVKIKYVENLECKEYDYIIISEKLKEKHKDFIDSISIEKIIH